MESQNPPPGKTTVASSYGRVLHDLGLLSKGDVILKNPSDFIGAVLGESEQKTVAILDAAVGSVLVIDEAYGLFSTAGNKNPYKVGCIAFKAACQSEQICLTPGFMCMEIRAVCRWLKCAPPALDSRH